MTNPNNITEGKNMLQETKHTPTPWIKLKPHRRVGMEGVVRVGYSNNIGAIAEFYYVTGMGISAEQTANECLKAVNNHEKLVEMVSNLEWRLRSYIDSSTANTFDGDGWKKVEEAQALLTEIESQ